METEERKARKREALRAFRARNPDYFKQKNKEWADRNRERVREHDRIRGRTSERRARCRDYYAKNRERLKAYQREYTATHLDDMLAYNEQRYRTPEVQARKALSRAVRYGKIVKPLHCDDCGHEKTKRQLHGHHEDYSKPLDVLWLCAACHGKRHRAD